MLLGCGALEPYAPQDFATASRAAVEAALAAIGPASKASAEAAEAPGYGGSSPQRPAADGGYDVDLSELDQLWAQAGSVVFQSPDLADWKQRALGALRLEDIYGPWLTGDESGDGWLRCRDPASSTGDRNPSAGVSSGTGEAERGSFHSFRTGETLDVFDFLQRHGGCAGFREAAERVAQLSGVPLPERAASPRPAQPPQPPQPPAPRAVRLPKIEVNARQMRYVVADAWSALLRANAAAEPIMFQRAGHLVRLRRTDADPRIEPMTEDVVYGHLLRIADWVRVSDLGEADATPPKDVPHDMLAFPDPRLPELEAVVSTPVFDHHGNLVATPGYHAASRLWFHERADFRLPAPVPEKPSESEIYAARSLLIEDLLQGFSLREALGSLPRGRCGHPPFRKAPGIGLHAAAPHRGSVPGLGQGAAFRRCGDGGNQRSMPDRDHH